MGKSAPKAPDPAETAAAQGQWNAFTAQQQQALNLVNQNSPWGSLQYTQSGSQTILDPNGKPVKIPRYTANTTLSPQQQAIFDQSQQASLNLAELATQQSGRLGELLSTPFSFNNQDAENWAFDIASSRLLPQQQQAEEALRDRLINSGIRPGSAAWQSEVTRQQQGNTDQLNQLALQGRSQAFNEALALRNQPINEILGLASGTQVQNPQGTFASSPQTQVAGVDYTGLVNQQYQQQQENYQAGLGGLFGLGSAVIGALPFSDMRLKTDIKRVGTLDNGLGVYSYRMIDGGPYQIGVMAQEVAEVNPDAVATDGDGWMRVDYERAVR